jgi:hypothetical protein
MRRKLGILILAGITALTGTQEAMRQFDGLRSSLNELTRASLWSGLIVYAQPVADGKLPAPQIYYLMPQTQTAPDPRTPLLADNRSNAANAPKPETKNNHVAEELAAVTSTDALMPLSLPLLREIEDAAKSELVLEKSELALDKLPARMAAHSAAVHAAASHVAAAPKLDRVRVYEEVARNEASGRRFRQTADVLAKVFVKELDEAKLAAELTRLAAAQEQLETPKLKSFTGAPPSMRRVELKVMRRPAHGERPERIRVIAPFADRRAIALPEISSIGCEKTKDSEAVKPAPVVETNIKAIVAAAGIAASVSSASEAMAAGEPGVPAALLPPSASWTLGCDTEPEYK